MMRTSVGVMAILALFGVGKANAEKPSWRYCEAGYVNNDVGLDGNASAGNIAAAFQTDDATGFNAACKFRLFMGVFLHGEYEQSNFDFDAAFSGDVTSAFSTGVDSDTLRIGAGLAYDVPALPMSVYGQLSYTQTEFDGNFSSFISDAGVAAFDTEQNGYDVEVGVRGVLLDRIDLGGYLRYTDVGSFNIPDSFAEIAADDEIRIGGQAAYNLIGPLWVTAKYETGDSDRLFVGARVAF